MNIEKYKLTVDGLLLSNNEGQVFYRCYNLLNKDGNCELIYRGENKQKLFDRYNCGDISSFSRPLFLIGKKVRDCLIKLQNPLKEKGNGS